jgi:hypothetical protein
MRKIYLNWIDYEDFIVPGTASRLSKSQPVYASGIRRTKARPQERMRSCASPSYRLTFATAISFLKNNEGCVRVVVVEYYLYVDYDENQYSKQIGMVTNIKNEMNACVTLEMRHG